MGLPGVRPPVPRPPAAGRQAAGHAVAAATAARAGVRAQGPRGTPYHFPVGDIKDYDRLSKEAWSRPLPLRCHDIAPHVAPFLYNTVQEHGKTCFSWFGPVPNVTISDPDLAKDVMSNKFRHFEKTKFPALSKLLAEGLASIEGQAQAHPQPYIPARESQVKKSNV
ncbi:hypothetical protein ACQ4PT_040612 [Festuca glaucescens]